MLMSWIAKELSLACLVEPLSDHEIRLGFASDILSDILSRAPKQSILVTSQCNLNVIAVASHANIHHVIFSFGHRPEEDAIETARRQGMGVYCSEKDTFELVGRLFELGVKGNMQ